MSGSFHVFTSVTSIATLGQVIRPHHGSMPVFDGSNLVLTLQKLLKGFGRLTLDF